MAQSKKQAPTDAELSAMFEGIGGDEEDASATTREQASKPPPSGSTDNDENDPLAELKNLASAPRTSTSTSRPETPHLTATTSTSRTHTPAGHRSNVYTPTTGSGRSSEERAAAEADPQRFSVDTQKRGPTSQAPLLQSDETEKAAGGSWWGGFTAIASAAVKQGQAALQEIQKNEEAQRWAEQVRGNYGALRGIGSKALPTFTNIIQTLAPPISQHERLQIHITHDLVNYPSLDPLIYQTFSRVMSQVEGGDLMVIQRGSESSQKRLEGYTGGTLGSGTGWSDGPWWRQDESTRSPNAVRGLVEGTKLARASAEGYGSDFFSSRGGVEEAAKAATASLSESNPTRSSDIFFAIQTIAHTAEKELFAAGASAEKSPSEEENVVIEDPPQPDELISFAIYLHDPMHSIAFSTLSQSLPQRWADWLERTEAIPQLPDAISEIIENDGVDPREWVAEWMEETLSLAVGIVAQRYVARRMGVGEGGIGRGKRRDVAVESGAGEAARAL